MRKSSGGERAWFLEEESEPRNKRIFVDLCSKSIGGSKGVCPFGRRAKPEKGRQRALASVGRGKAKLFPLQGIDGENSRADESAYLAVTALRF
ncbi:MAG: hypothetical protein ACE5L7_03490 [Candidatus Aminicenantales bacterium]